MGSRHPGRGEHPARDPSPRTSWGPRCPSAAHPQLCAPLSRWCRPGPVCPPPPPRKGCRQNKAETPGPRPLSPFPSSAVRVGAPGTGQGAQGAVLFFTCVRLTCSQTPSPPTPAAPHHPREAPHPPDPGVQLCCGTEQRGLPDICKLSSRLSGMRACDPDQSGKGGVEGREDPALSD